MFDTGSEFQSRSAVEPARNSTNNYNNLISCDGTWPQWLSLMNMNIVSQTSPVIIQSVLLHEAFIQDNDYTAEQPYISKYYTAERPNTICILRGRSAI